jgi:hypothetical protein
MQRKYLELSRASQIDSAKDRAFFRLFEILPGAISWSTLLFAIFFSYRAPNVVAIFIICFDLLWLVRIFYLSFHQLTSFRELQKNLKINWLQKLKTEYPRAWQNIYHLIILPIYKEEIEIIESSLKGLKNCFYPKNKMMVVLATEERGGEKTKEIAQKIKEKYEKNFFRFLITSHPQNIEGEVVGKGSNVAWAQKEAKKKLIDPPSLPEKKIIVSNFDVDTKPYPQYFASLTWHYLNSKNPLRSSYQPIPLYNNNIWQAPAFSRVIATSGTFWQMMQQERPEQLVTYSSHALPFKLFGEVGYPSNVVSDDSRIFWKAYLFYNGDYRVSPLYYPVSMDAVMAKNFLGTVINQYRQQRRWAWGVENIPYLFFNFIKNKKISLFDKIRHSIIILEGFWSWATSALLIFFLGWLPVISGGEEFNLTLLSYNLPRLTSDIMTIAMIGMIIGAGISFSLLPPKPPQYSKSKSLSMIFQWLLLPFTLIIFGALPALEAQTRLMLGRHLPFWATEKARK